eukprot:11504478-Alexandrium_andersonii.AAC.1
MCIRDRWLILRLVPSLRFPASHEAPNLQAALSGGGPLGIVGLRSRPTSRLPLPSARGAGRAKSKST